MNVEVREVEVRGTQREVGLLYIDDSPPWGLRLVVSEVEYLAVGVDLFDSLGSLRRLLEGDDRMLCVEGARYDVFPSGMSRQMSGGRGAYRLVRGQRPGPADLVDIFDHADCGEVVAVDEQIGSVRSIRGTA